MAKNLVATDTSLEYYINGVLQKTFPRGEIKTEVTNNSVRVTILRTGESFSLFKSDSVSGEQQESLEEIAKLVGAFSKGGDDGNGVINWETLEGKPEVIAYGETEQEARESIGAAGVSDLPDSATTSNTGLVKQSEPVTNLTTEDATELDSAILLVNSCKIKINELLSELRTAGILST